MAAPSLNTGNAAGDRLVNVEGLILGAGNDRAYGDAGDNRINGNGGNDLLYGALGADYLDGGAGFDYARFDDAGYAGLTADLGNIVAGTGAALGDTYVGIEGLVLTGNDDVGFGDGGDNFLYGFAGDDALDGRGGHDNLFGGAGADTFAFDAPAGAADADVIGDFAVGIDHIALASALYGAADLGSGNEELVVAANAAAATGAATLLFDTLSGLLSYDADGTGAGAALAIATLQGPNLAAFSGADIAIV
jgi:Ca2+-binding RTX toxin-like protein